LLRKISKARRRRSWQPTGGVLDAGEVVPQIAKIGEHDRADELGVTAGEAFDHVALRPDDRAHFGEVAADVDNLADDAAPGGGLGEHVLLEFLQFFAEFVERGGVVVHEEIQQGVSEAVGAAATTPALFTVRSMAELAPISAARCGS